MKTHPPPHGPGADPNQGEGDRLAARRYNRKARAYAANGEVDDAARAAAAYVEADPDGARRAERAARKGPHRTWVSVDELVAKGRSVVERVRSAIGRVVDLVRARHVR